MKRKKPIPEWLRQWQAKRPRYENFAVPEGEGMIGPTEDDVQDSANDASARSRKRRGHKPAGPQPTG
jgi:hypothetical protein